MGNSTRASPKSKIIGVIEWADRHPFIGFAMLVAALVPLFAFTYFAMAQQSSRQAEEPPPSKYDAHLLELDKAALEQAYHDQLKLLFSVWLKDGAGSDAARISNGLRIARRAYIQAATQIEQREKKDR